MKKFIKICLIILILITYMSIGIESLAEEVAEEIEIGIVKKENEEDSGNQFAEFVKLIDKQKIELQKSLEEMEKLQESLMNKYFG